MIRDLPADGVVREAAAYRIPMALYHTQSICPGPSVSSGGLRTLWLDSPADYWAYSDLNPERFTKEPSEAMIFGRAAHHLLLGEDDFEGHFAILPASAPPRPTIAQVRAAEAGRVSASAAERFEFWQGFEASAEGRTIIREEWMETICHMSRALAKHPLVGPLFDGEPEVSFIWQDEQTGLWLKSRPDMMPRMGGMLSDLKTCSDAHLRAVARDTRKYEYRMQMALAAIGCEVCTDQKIESTCLIFVEKTPAWNITPYEITEDSLHFAKLKLRVAINRLAHCLETGDWPGKVEGVPKDTMSEAEVLEIASMQAAGTFPHDFFGSFGDGEVA